MKKTFACAVIFLMAVVMTGPAGAVSMHWTDTWTPDGGPIDLNYWNRSYTFQHNIADDGFDYGLDEVELYRLSVRLYDDSRHDGWEWAFIDLPGQRTDEAVEVDYNNIRLGWSWKGLTSLNTDGLLDITIYWLCGDFRLLGSRIDAIGVDGVHTPVPASVLMLATGLIGLIGYQRRGKNKLPAVNCGKISS